MTSVLVSHGDWWLGFQSQLYSVLVVCEYVEPGEFPYIFDSVNTILWVGFMARVVISHSLFSSNTQKLHAHPHKKCDITSRTQDWRCGRKPDLKSAAVDWNLR